ncbi:MAG: hypothetical protein ABIO76_12515 [Ginsengibacter sp.]
MKNILFGYKPITFLIVVLIVLSLNSCKKDNDPPPTYHIEGLWTGTIENETSGPQFYSLSIKPGGTLTFDGIGAGQQHLGIGTWSLNGNTFTSFVTTVYGISTNVGVKQTLTAEFNNRNGTLIGTWENTSPANDSGTFSLTKVK